jgi:hypothetical protein
VGARCLVCVDIVLEARRVGVEPVTRPASRPDIAASGTPQLMIDMRKAEPVPREKLEAGVRRTAKRFHYRRELVLFVPGVTVTPEVNYGWN